MHSAPQLISRIETLASLPAIYVRMREELASPESSINQVARIAATDPALTARLLKIVNSALYGYDRSIESVYHAITIVGLQQVQDLVLALSISSVFNELHPRYLDMHRFWRGSLLRGLMARQLGEHCKLPASERLFTIGLLADIGHLVLYQNLPELSERARRQAQEDGIPLHEAEWKLIGCNYAEIGAALLERWKLPVSFPAIIGAQHRPRLAGKFAYEATILQVAAHFAAAAENADPQRLSAEIPSATWTQLGMNVDTAALLFQAARRSLADCFDLFFPKLK